jgi:hypothetical protein
MSGEESTEKRIFRAALTPGDDCLPIEQLEKCLLDGSTPPAALAKHLESCAYCRTEVQLLREFHDGSPRETEMAAVQVVASRLQERSGEIFQSESAAVEIREPWWRFSWRAPWHGPAALAFAGIVVMIAIGLQPRNTPPVLHQPGIDREVLRSNAIAVISPSGDIQEAPGAIRWQTAPGAMKYVVRLREVDGTELWSAETAQSTVDVPAEVRARIVPAKTLLCQVSAFDAAGRQVAISDTVRFRVLQKRYQP